MGGLTRVLGSRPGDRSGVPGVLFPSTHLGSGMIPLLQHHLALRFFLLQELPNGDASLDSSAPSRPPSRRRCHVPSVYFFRCGLSSPENLSTGTRRCCRGAAYTRDDDTASSRRERHLVGVSRAPKNSVSRRES